MARMIDCLIIGAGQAGLAMSQCLTAGGIEHVVLERGRIGERWRSERWPSLRLLTPGWMTRMPGGALAQKSDGFLTSSDLVERLETYAATHEVPLQDGTEVLAVEPMGDRFRIVTSSGTWIARALVVATGACDRPRIPAWSLGLDHRIHRIAPSQYRGADQLPDGGVLVVGGSATGVQLAREAAASGRRTVLAAGRHVRTPRRYRGMDLFEWLDFVGFLNETRPQARSFRELMAQPSLQLVGGGANGDIDFATLAAEGVTIAGRALGASGATIGFASDLARECAAAERRRHTMLERIDAEIAQWALDVEPDPAAWEAPAALPEAPTQIDLVAEGISSVIWATGYRRSYPWLHLDALDEHGEIAQQDGIARLPGLYVLGLPFMRHRASSFIDGVGRDAEAISQTIIAQLGARQLRVA
ncbi:flavin-containing monooxygenase [Altererythrobacter sp. Z27]|uniref:flavin-containing monooxygenase n=1 Tax=Altererythrobacter sp. Z27 TaxID=3461147 RepID=UPI004043B69B